MPNKVVHREVAEKVLALLQEVQRINSTTQHVLIVLDDRRRATIAAIMEICKVEGIPTDIAQLLVDTDKNELIWEKSP